MKPTPADMPGQFDNFLINPPALHRAELRDAAFVQDLGGSNVLQAAARKGLIFNSLEELVAAGYDATTRRPRPPETPPPAA